EQATRIQAIKEKYDDQLAESGRKVRLARRAFQQSLINPDATEAEQGRLADELAKAQEAQWRLNAQMRIEQSHVLTPDQIRQLREMQQQFQQNQRQGQRLLQMQDPDTQPARPPESSERDPNPNVDPFDLLLGKQASAPQSSGRAAGNQQ
ncbi:MAG TPA: hypothetical protein VI756_03615, partial [Blastocatellia bacterium]